MLDAKTFLILLVFIVLTLFLRDLPYVNVVFISRMWLIYFALLLFIVLINIRFRVIFLWYTICTLLFAAFMLTLMRLSFFAESIGILIYFFLWAILIHRLIGFVKSRQ